MSTPYILLAILGSLAAGAFIGRMATLAASTAIKEKARLFEQSNRELSAKLTDQEAHLREVLAREAVLGSERDFLQRQLEEQKADVEQLQERFKTEFRNVANELLEEKARVFTRQNKENLDQILTPFNARIEEFKKKVDEVYRLENDQRNQLQGEIKNMMALNERITRETENLTKALRTDSKQQGSWGEVVLQRILERSGLREGHEIHTQQSHQTEDGQRLQPDVVVQLPDEKYIVIDSKVSLTAYERFVSDEDPDRRQPHLADHVRSIRGHVRSLQSKRYDALHGDRSPDFVLMFIPIESAYSAALQTDVDLYRDAFSANIILVSPTTLMATLATIETIWRQERQNRYAMEIARRGGYLVDKFASFVDTLEQVGSRLDQARNAYDKAFGQLKTGSGNLVAQAVKLRELGVKASKELSSKALEGAQLEDPDTGESGWEGGSADEAQAGGTSPAASSDL